MRMCEFVTSIAIFDAELVPGNSMKTLVRTRIRTRRSRGRLWAVDSAAEALAKCCRLRVQCGAVPRVSVQVTCLTWIAVIFL